MRKGAREAESVGKMAYTREKGRALLFGMALPLCMSMNDFMDLLQSAGRLGREEADFPLQNPWGVAIIK